MVRLVMAAESVLRLLSLVFAALTACLMGLNEETQVLFLQKKTADVKVIRCFWILTVVSSVVGGCHLIQLIKCFTVGRIAKKSIQGKKLEGWISLILDQSTTYVMLAALAAAMQAGIVAITGQREFQWMKLTDFFPRFYRQKTGGIVCAVMASCAMCLVNIISSHQLFMLYFSPSASSSNPSPLQ